MNNQEAVNLLALVAAQNAMLEKIAGSLAQIARAHAPDNPNYVRPLNEYAAFDWSSIGAEVIGRDTDGPTLVLWNDYEWRRRTGGSRKFTEAVWFSRYAGEAEDGEKLYHRLVIFRDGDEIDPLPRSMVDTKAPVKGTAAPRRSAKPPTPVTPPPSHQATGSWADLTAPEPARQEAAINVPNNPRDFFELVNQYIDDPFTEIRQVAAAIGGFPAARDKQGWEAAFYRLTGGGQ